MATKQVEACACTCCHDARQNGGQTGQWDIRHGPIWLDTLSDSGVALFIGAADSSALGAYPAAINHGFDRDATGLPTNDTARLQAFLRTELTRRGISEEQANAVPPFGGPIYTNRFMQPVACVGQGVDAAGLVQLGNLAARYVYVTAEGSNNPGVPPNLDTPAGTIWRLDVLPSAAALSGSFAYGTTPSGSFQVVPERGRAPTLRIGTRYHFVALRDVGIPVANCIFSFGEAPPAADGGVAALGQAGATGTVGAAASGGMSGTHGGCQLPGGDPSGFGASCHDGKTAGDCACAADCCALMPGQTSGYCTVGGCKADPGICPAGWSCLDLSVFSAGLPAICARP